MQWTIPGPRVTQTCVGVDAGVAVFIIVGVNVGVNVGVDVSVGGTGVSVAVGTGVACVVQPAMKKTIIKKKDNNFIWGFSLEKQ